MLTFQSVQEERRAKARSANALLTSLLTAMEHARPLVPTRTAQNAEMHANTGKRAARTRSAFRSASLEKSFAMGNARTKTGVPTKTAQNAEIHANTGKNAARTRSAFRSASMEKSFAKVCARRTLGVQTKTAPNATTSAQRERHARTSSAYRNASLGKSFAKMCARRILGVRTKTAQNAEIPARTERLASTSNANALREKRTESATNNEKASCTAQPCDPKEKVVSFVIPFLAYHKRSKNM